MSFKINKPSEIKIRLGINPGGKVQKFFTQTCANYMDKYVPYRDGTLRANKVLTSNTITYISPYARYQYFGKLYVDPKTKKGAFYSPTFGYWSRPGVKKEPTNIDLNYHTAGTGSRWDKLMMSAEKQDVINEVQNFIKTRGNV